MAGYTKLFNSILASTIWRADDKTRIVWITLLAMADKNGIAEGSVPGLADFARVSIPDTRKALQALSSPDEDSRSQEYDGRRIEAVDGGWRLLNHTKYRERLNTDERREYLKTKQREYRARRKQASTTVNNVSDKSTPYTQAEAEAEAEATTKKKRQTARAAPIARRRNLHAAFEGARGLYVLQSQHQKFLDLLNGAVSESELFAWYEVTAEEWATGDRSEEQPDANMPAFWDKRFEERWPPAKKKRGPAWLSEPT